MLRLLIVEDEQVARDTISNLIDWCAHGVELVGACPDGVSAYDMIVDEYPDIVMTDIRMPGLDGLGLIERVRRMDCDIRFIILSGFGEFDYAKKAMAYGVRHYLLKPCNENHILEAIGALRPEITRQKEISRMIQEINPMTGQMGAAIKKHFTVEAVTNADDFTGLLERYGSLLVFPKGSYYLYYVSFLDETCLSEFVEQTAACDELFNFNFCFNILYVKNTALLMLCVNEKSDMSGFENMLGKIHPQGSEVNLLWWKNGHDTVQSMLEELVQQLRRYDRIILVDDDYSHQEIYNYMSAFHRVEPTVQFLGEAVNSDDVFKLLNNFFGRVEDVELARMLAMRLVTQFANQARLLSAINNVDFFSSLYSCAHVTDVYDLTGKQILNIFDMYKRQKKNYKDFVEQAKLYVQDHLDNPQLSMKWLAEEYLYINVDYFSRQFYQQTGEKFSAYLAHMRMEKAKQLMLQYDSDRVYKVADQIGCGHNPQYFSQLFKKWTGLTPSQYRERHINCKHNSEESLAEPEK